MTNPYAPPSAAVADIGDFRDTSVPADRALRLGAAILDSIIMFILVYVPLIAGVLLDVGIAGSTNDEPSTGTAVGLIFAFVGFLIWLALTLYFLNKNSQSVAKRVVGIKLVRSDGSPVSMGRVILLRNILNGIIGIIPLYSLIDILFIFGESRQCLHDKIADTIVVKA